MPTFSQGKYHELDGLRAIAILLVVGNRRAILLDCTLPIILE